MKFISALFVLLLIVPLAACAQMHGSEKLMGNEGGGRPVGFAAKSRSMSADVSHSSQGGAIPDQRMLLKSASLGLEVDEEEIEATSAKASALVSGAGGTTERSTRNPDGSYYLDFRVPSDRLDETLASLEELGEPVSRSAQVVDVTNQAIDLDAKITNLRGLRDRMRALLDRASKIDEILKIERELNRIQTQLDSLEGQRKRLTRDVAMSSLGLRLDPAESEMILGPLGYVGAGAWWLLEKLFVIRR